MYLSIRVDKSDMKKKIFLSFMLFLINVYMNNYREINADNNPYWVSRFMHRRKLEKHYTCKHKVSHK